jgi:hypothetical protein
MDEKKCEQCDCYSCYYDPMYCLLREDIEPCAQCESEGPVIECRFWTEEL